MTHGAAGTDAGAGAAAGVEAGVATGAATGAPPATARWSGIDWVKLAAFGAMLVDHTGGLVLRLTRDSWMYQLGRLSFPLFALVLAYKLAVRQAQGHDTLVRSTRSLLVWALVAQIPYALAAGRWFPANAFFTLWLGCLACRLSVLPLTMPVRAGWLFIVAAAPFADYGLSGILLLLSIFLAVLLPAQTLPPRSPVQRLDPAALLAGLLCLTLLAVGNDSWWTLAAIPVAGLLLHLPPVSLGRGWWPAAYTLHLALIGLWRLSAHPPDWSRWLGPPSCLRRANDLPSLLSCWI